MTVFCCADGEITKKIKYLRCQYVEENKKEKKSRNGMGADEVYVSKWKFYQLLGFLVNYINYAGKHPTTSNLQAEVCNSIFTFLLLLYRIEDGRKA